MRPAKSKNRVIIWALPVAIILAEIAGRFAGLPTLPPDPTFIDANEWSYPDWIEKDAELFWRYRPARTIDHDFFKPGEYAINSHGFRGPEFVVEKPNGIIRVICLGESSTFGLGVTENAVWPRQLERHLNGLDPQRRRWEVLNLGVTNYSTYQGVRLARRVLPHLKPDYVLYCFSWADHQPAANGVPDDRVNSASPLEIRLEGILNHSAAVRWSRCIWRSIFPVGPPEVAPLGPDQRRVPSTEFSENIEKITREAIQAGARPVLVTSPISWPPPGQTDTSGFFAIHQRYRRLARFGSVAAGGQFVELANAFDDFPRFYDDRRIENELFNAQGHAFAGEFLARYLLGDTAIINNFGSQSLTDDL